MNKDVFKRMDASGPKENNPLMRSGEAESETVSNSRNHIAGSL